MQEEEEEQEDVVDDDDDDDDSDDDDGATAPQAAVATARTQTTQADLDRNVVLLVYFLWVKSSVYLLIQSLSKQSKGILWIFNPVMSWIVSRFIKISTSFYLDLCLFGDGYHVMITTYRVTFRFCILISQYLFIWAGLGTIDFPNFLMLMAKKLKEYEGEESLRLAFRVFDKEDNGTVIYNHHHHHHRHRCRRHHSNLE